MKTVICDIDGTIFNYVLNGHYDLVHNPPQLLNGVLDKDKTEDEIIGIVYHFMNERLCRKCDDLLPELKRYDANINLPYGQEWANWMYSEERKWQNRASLFHTVTGE